MAPHLEVRDAVSAPKTAELLPNGTLKVYAGNPHGAFTIHADESNADLLEFIKA